MEIHIIANGTFGSSMSGGDRILIEMAKRWKDLCCDIFCYVNEEGYDLYTKNGLNPTKYVIWRSQRFKRYGFFVFYLGRIISGIINSINVRPSKNSLLYSASDFLPDCIPALIIKLRLKKEIIWIAGFYLFAPKPFSRDNPYRGFYWLKGILYYLSQLPIYLLIKKIADKVCVTSKPDVKRFITSRRSINDIIVMQGGVDFKSYNQFPESKEKKFDAVFIGRLHPQKGILELIDIWKIVTQYLPDAKLAIIGDGPLEYIAKKKAEKYRIAHLVSFFGFKDGMEKIKIFKSSKIVVHPAIYDSGGMAACEAMACGLPGVAFDLEALKTYYPKGVLKVPCFNKAEFANTIVRLLEDKEQYFRTQKEAVDLARSWDWDIRASKIFYQFTL